MQEYYYEITALRLYHDKMFHVEPLPETQQPLQPHFTSLKSTWLIIWIVYRRL